MKTGLICILVSFFSLCAFSQEPAPYTGKVSAANTPLSGATVALLKNSDSSLVKLSLTNNEGRFEFTGIQAGNYLYLVTSVGYDSLYIKAVENEPAQIALVQSAQALNSVTVVSKRPLVEARLDKMIVNVD